MYGKSSGGSTRGLVARRDEGPRIPRETGSALFVAEGTYMGRIVMLLGIMDEVIRWIESLRGMLRDLPLSTAPMTPVLSPWIVIVQSTKFRLIKMRMASSRAIDLAQPISIPSAFHPGISFHAAHW